MNTYATVLRALGRPALPPIDQLRSTLQSKPGHRVIGRTDQDAITLGNRP